jgi:structural maintenance of chromosome 1
MKAELAQARPDLKSSQRFQDVEVELEKMQAEQEDLRTKAGDLKRNFAEVKQRRREMFMALYDTIDRTIDPVYKKLTRVRDQGNRSGTAYFALEDTEEPYLGGITFTAMPPHKRFRDLEQLSGGEKAVASLALIVALQRELHAPFVLMDEPDASLDKLNLRAAATALRDMAHESQIVSVSLRDRFFEYADVLVGVYKDGQSSGIATLDLQKFVQPSLVMEPLD